MTDLDANYATNAAIKQLCFKGQTVPDENTIPTDEYLELKTYIDGLINDVNNWTSNYADHATYPFFKNTFIRLMKQHLRGEDAELTEEEERKLITRFGNIPIACSIPDDDFIEPDPA